ncbi:MAG: hypothetical protein ACI4E1_11825 [Lachnospira sp.]
MIITEEILRNLELKKGILSTERCDEIDAMKIKNPYYPSCDYLSGEYYEAERNETYICALDGRIAYTWASVFGPLPITFREHTNTYDDIYLLFIDNEYFELIFEFDSQEHYNDEENNAEKSVNKLYDNWVMIPIVLNDCIEATELYKNQAQAILEEAIHG